MLDAPSVFCLHIDSELPRFHPAPIEVELDLLFTIVNDWEEQHIDKVLDS